MFLRNPLPLVPPQEQSRSSRICGPPLLIENHPRLTFRSGLLRAEYAEGLSGALSTLLSFASADGFRGFQPIDLGTHFLDVPDRSVLDASAPLRDCVNVRAFNLLVRLAVDSDFICLRQVPKSPSL